MSVEVYNTSRQDLSLADEVAEGVVKLLQKNGVTSEEAEGTGADAARYATQLLLSALREVEDDRSVDPLRDQHFMGAVRVIADVTAYPEHKAYYLACEDQRIHVNG